MENEETATSRWCALRAFGAKLRHDAGALTTELAILVAVLVFIAAALATIMRTSATNHQACIPQNPGDPVPAGC